MNTSEHVQREALTAPSRIAKIFFIRLRSVSSVQCHLSPTRTAVFECLDCVWLIFVLHSPLLGLAAEFDFCEVHVPAVPSLGQYFFFEFVLVSGM